MRRSLSILGAAATVLAVSLGSTATASASPVTYSTVGCFGASCTPGVSANFVTANGATITFNGLGSTAVSTPTNISLGNMVSSFTSGTGVIASTPFTLQITQTVPSGGSGTFSASVFGTIQAASNNGQLTFSTTSLLIGTTLYTVLNNPLSLVAPNTNNGITSVQAAVSTVPEPTSVALLGAGLVGLAAGARRRSKKNAAK